MCINILTGDLIVNLRVLILLKNTTARYRHPLKIERKYNRGSSLQNGHVNRVIFAHYQYWEPTSWYRSTLSI